MNSSYNYTSKAPNLGALVRSERHALGLTQTELGTLLGISPSYVSSLERNLRTPSSGLLQKLHTILHISYDYLFDRAPYQVSLLRESPSPYEVRMQSLFVNTSPADQEICYRLCQAYLLTRQHGESASSTKMSSQAPIPEPQLPKEDR